MGNMNLKFLAFGPDSVSHDKFATPSLPWWCTVPARWWSRGQWLWPQPAGLRWCRQPGWPGWCWTGACAPCAGCRRCCRPPAAPPAGRSGHTHLYRDKEEDVHVERETGLRSSMKTEMVVCSGRMDGFLHDCSQTFCFFVQNQWATKTLLYYTLLDLFV